MLSLSDPRANKFNPELQYLQLWSGSILETSFLGALRLGFRTMAAGDEVGQGGICGLACIEVIEHLPSVAAAVAAVSGILSALKPHIACVTTPNYEANPVLSRASQVEIIPEDSPVCNSDSDSFTVPFREADHKVNKRPNLSSTNFIINYFQAIN